MIILRTANLNQSIAREILRRMIVETLENKEISLGRSFCPFWSLKYQLSNLNKQNQTLTILSLSNLGHYL